MLAFHRDPLPTVCEACAYAVERNLDCAYEHARTRAATNFLLQDLEDLAGGSASLRGLAVSSTGVEPGPVHELDPRHWYWAIYFSPEVQLSLKE